MTLSLKSVDKVADFLLYVADLLRMGVVSALSINLSDDGQPSRVTIVFKSSPPAEKVEAIKKLEE